MTKKKTRLAAMLVCLISLFTALFNIPGLTTQVSAAGTVTSFGLAEHGIMAFNDGWVYSYGGKGETNSNGVRQSDCAGLICAYFTDNSVQIQLGGVTTLLRNEAASGDIYSLPRVHGLLITIPNNDHIGIYIGNGEAVDNSDYGVNMLWGNVFNSDGSARRGWYKWHIMDGGIVYGWNGFYAFNGNMYHYTNGQYDINTTVEYNGTTYTIGADGIVRDSDDAAIAVDTSMENSGYVSASTVAEAVGGGNVPEGTAAEVTGSGVRMRKDASTSSSIVATLSQGTKVYVTETVNGESVTSGGSTSTRWYKCTTLSGLTGYMSAVFVNLSGDVVSLDAPVISLNGTELYIAGTSENAAIYYTTDCSTPSESNGTIYTGALSAYTSTTYKAVAVEGNSVSDVSVLTILRNGSAFTDIQTNQWYFNTVEQAVDLGILSGKGNQKMAPSANTTRAEFLQILANALNVDLSVYTSPSFSDVPASAWYAPVIAWAESNAYVSGDKDNKFKPTEPITREEMCVILANVAGLEAIANYEAFADESSIASSAVDAVYACREAGLISGVGNNQFNPKGNTTRAQAATVALKYLDLF